MSNFSKVFDPTMTNPENLISAEPHDLSNNAAKVILLNEGAYYYDSIVIQDSTNNTTLTKGNDYKYIFFDSEASAAVDGGKDIVVGVSFNNPNITSDVLVTYHAIGGYYGQSLSLTRELTRLISAAQSGLIPWSRVQAPASFPPAPHTHPLNQLTELYILKAEVEKLNNALRDSTSIGTSSIAINRRIDRTLKIIASLRSDLNSLEIGYDYSTRLDNIDQSISSITTAINSSNAALAQQVSSSVDAATQNLVTDIQNDITNRLANYYTKSETDAAIATAQTNATNRLDALELVVGNNSSGLVKDFSTLSGKVDALDDQINQPPNGIINKLAETTTLANDAKTASDNIASSLSTAEQTLLNNSQALATLTAQYTAVQTQLTQVSQQVTTAGQLPIGTIYINAVDNSNPASILGYGVWVRTAQGRSIAGVGTTTDARGETYSISEGETGGEKNHQLSIAEMPGHSHGVNTTNGTPIVLRQSTGGASETVSSIDTTNGEPNVLNNFDTFLLEGGSQAHNNTSPYEAFNVWKRTA